MFPYSFNIPYLLLATQRSVDAPHCQAPHFPVILKLAQLRGNTYVQQHVNLKLPSRGKASEGNIAQTEPPMHERICGANIGESLNRWPRHEPCHSALIITCFPGLACENISSCVHGDIIISVFIQMCPLEFVRPSTHDDFVIFTPELFVQTAVL